jgi:hypothetical protein
MAYTAIDDPSAHFQIALWTGDGSETHAITNDGNSDLQPDLVWIKCRSDDDDHILANTSSGATKYLIPNTTGTEQTYAGNVKSFDSDGFTVGDGNQINQDTRTFVGWQWKANGGSRTTNAEDGNNPAGGYQANTTAGFSIVDYTGTGAAGTMAHGLGAVPDLIIIKNRDEADDWVIYHSANTAAPETDYLVLNLRDATADDATYWNDTAPTSSVFTVATDHEVNADAEKYMAYVFAEKQGFSKFGSYTGNGNADGPFVYTGFKPAWLLIKPSSIVEDWRMYDNKRSTFNVMDKQLFMSASRAYTSVVYYLDFLSNGFKIRSSHGGFNTDDTAHIYMAFAESPFVTSGGVPCTGR